MRSISRVFAGGLALGLIALGAGAAAEEAGTHTVSPGETMWRIAHRHGTTVEALAAANHMPDVTRLQAGARLRIPGAADDETQEDAAVLGVEPAPLAEPLLPEPDAMVPEPDAMAQRVPEESEAAAVPIDSAEGDVDSAEGDEQSNAEIAQIDSSGGVAAPVASEADAAPVWTVERVVPTTPDVSAPADPAPELQHPAAEAELLEQIAPEPLFSVPPIRPLPPVSAAPSSWVLGASNVTGSDIGEIQLAALDQSTALAASATHELTPSASTRTVAFERPSGDDDLLHQLEIEHGKSVYLKTDYDIKRVSVGNSEIVDVVVLSKRSVQLVAREIGGTNVILWNPTGRPQAAIDVHVGTVRSHLESVLRRVMVGEDVRVESAGNGVALVGSVSSALAMEQALAVSQTFLGEDSEERVVNLLSVAGNQQVMLRVVVAELSRTLGRGMSTNFAGVVETDGKVFAFDNFLDSLLTRDQDGDLFFTEAANLLTAFEGLGSLSFIAAMELFEREGLGKILAEPTLVARSGETASFLAGGEVPIPIAQGGAFGSITIEFKKFGVGVAFTPTVLGPDRIHLNVSPEVSEPDFNFGTEVDGTVVPGFVTRRASTSVELRDGQSFAVAGLLSESVREVASKYPLLGDIPVLGALFRSSQFQKNETELVIIVTPHLVKPLGPPPHSLPGDEFVEPSALDFFLFGRLEGREDPPLQTGNLEPERSGGLIGDAGHRLPAGSEEDLW